MRIVMGGVRIAEGVLEDGRRSAATTTTTALIWEREDMDCARCWGACILMTLTTGLAIFISEHPLVLERFRQREDWAG